MEVDPKQVASMDAPYWAWLNQIRIDGRPFTLEGRKYQLEIMRPVTDDGKVKTNEVIRKAAQVGITMCKVIEITHGALYGLYQQGIIYYFPSGKSVEHFSKTRFKPFLDDNDGVRKQCNDINAVAIRRIGNTNVNFFGCSPTIFIGGEAKDSVSVRSTPADWILLDERDLFDAEMAKQVNQRLGNSLINRRTDIGTPKLPDDGTDLLYKKSDMRRWQIKCESCRKHTCLETEFPKIIKLEPEPHYVCVHCDSEIFRENGIWVPDSPEKETVGYWPSQLLNPNRNPARILKEFDDPEAFDLDEAEFQRTVLGLPFVSIYDRLSESDVFACCCGDQMDYSHNGPCAMGVDIGNTIHVVIGHRIGNDRFRLVKMARVPDFPALHDLAGRFNVKSCVIDAQPDIHAPREFQKSEPYAIYLCFYSEHLKMFDIWDENKIVKVNRTEIFDATHRIVTSPGRLMIPRMCEEVKIFAHQMIMTAKSVEKDKRTGDLISRYHKLGDKEDHYRNALNYFYLACKKVGIPQSVSSRPRATMQDMTYKL